MTKYSDIAIEIAESQRKRTQIAPKHVNHKRRNRTAQIPAIRTAVI